MPTILADPTRLYANLLNSGLQAKDNSLYQVIYLLIGDLGAATKQVNTITSSLSSSSPSTTPSTSPIVPFPLDGQDGIDGSDGLIGPVGPQGISGLQGFPGDDGQSPEDSIFIPRSINDLTAGILSVGNGGTGTGIAFTQGSVIFAGASGIYSQDNSRFFWDDTNFQLGVGTIPSSVFSGVFAKPLTILSQTDTTATVTNSKGPLVLVNPDTTANNVTSILFATFDNSGNIKGNAQIVAQFTAARGANYTATDLVFCTGTTAGPVERFRITSTGIAQLGVANPIAAGSIALQINKDTANVGTAPTIRLLGFSPSYELLNKDSTQNYYFGIQDAAGGDNKFLYIGAGYGPGQAITPIIKASSTGAVTIPLTLNVTGVITGGADIQIPDSLVTGAFKIGSLGSYLARQASDGSTILNTAQGYMSFQVATSEKLRLFNSGGLNLGATSDPGAGVISYNLSKNFSWNSKTNGTVYQALSDGLVVMAFNGNNLVGAQSTVQCLSDSSNPPTTVRAQWSSPIAATSGEGTTLTFAVLKGDFYKVIFTPGAGGSLSLVSMFWVPLGTAG